MSLMKYSPFFGMRDLDSAFDEIFNLSPMQKFAVKPDVDIIDAENNLRVEIECAGMSPDDIDVTIEGRMLVISGEKKTSRNDEQDKYLRAERLYGKFVRSFTVPENLDLSQASAKAENGVVVVTIPREEKEVSQKLKIEIEQTKE